MTGPTHDGRRPAILAIDTRDDPGRRRDRLARTGVLDGLIDWPAGYRHGETLLPAIGRFLGEQNIAPVAADRRSSSGPGPGAFTGLRVGIATAKGLAHGLGCPLVGVSTAEALCSAVAGPDGGADPVLLLPAGPSDRVARPRRARRPILLPAGSGAGPRAGRASSSRSTSTDARRPTPLERGEAARAGPGRRARRGSAPPRLRRRRRGRPGRPRARVRDAAARRRAPRRGGGVVARPPVRLRIEPMRLEDLPAVHAIERASFDAPWPPEAYRNDLETNRLAQYLVARVGDEVAAYGGMWLMVDEGHIITFAVHPGVAPPAHRRAAAAGVPRPGASIAARTRRRSRSACPTCRPAGCTRSSASGRSACGRATTATTARTR